MTLIGRHNNILRHDDSRNTMVDLTNQVFEEQENNGEEHDKEDLKFS
jgi:hypothetical protein